MPLQLVILGKTGPERTLPLDKDVFRIGRTESCDLYLADAFVTRLHATIYLMDHQYQIIDEGSPNGTLLNNEKLDWHQPRVLSHGDEILIGNTLIKVADPNLQAQNPNEVLDPGPNGDDSTQNQ
jgi:pSer/pThr/pTyr-binding forkhead associated (FHA) protein